LQRQGNQHTPINTHRLSTDRMQRSAHSTHACHSYSSGPSLRRQQLLGTGSVNIGTHALVCWALALPLGKSVCFVVCKKKKERKKKETLTGAADQQRIGAAPTLWLCTELRGRTQLPPKHSSPLPPSTVVSAASSAQQSTAVKTCSVSTTGSL
jgi:hypothetical protein